MLKFRLLTTLSVQLIAFALCLLCAVTATAQSASQVSVTGTGTIATVPNNVATVVDPNLVISANGNITGFTVTITGSYTNGDILGYNGALPPGITASSFNTATRSIQFSGTASPTVWQDLLRRVTIRTTSAVCFPEQRKVSFNFGTVFYNILNDHFYQLVTASTTWTNARAIAQNSSYFGYQGYLTTITSAAENSFIQAFTNTNSWLGCSDNFNEINSAVGFTQFANQSAAEGRWYWVTGPERGTHMRNGNATGNNVGAAISGVYQAWAGGEPNDCCGGGIGEEDYGHMINNTGQWNDFPNGVNIAYLVEYGGMPTDLSTSTVVYTRTLNVNGAPTTGVNGGNTTVCSGGGATLTLAPFTGTVVRWEWSTDDFLTAGNAIANTSTTLNVTGLTESRYYRAIINTTAPACSNLATSSTLLTVAASNGGVINAQSNTICAGGSAVLTLFGNQGSVLDWQRSTASNFATFTTINSTSTTISNTIPSAGTYYFRARVQNNGCGTPVFSGVYTITVNSGTPPIGGSVSNATHCGGTNSGTLTLSGHTGTVQSWQFSDDFGVVWTTVANTSTSISYSGITATRYYRAVLQNGSCGTAFSNVGMVTVYNFAASNSGPVCSGTTLQLGVTTTGGSGPFTFAWTGPNGFSSSLQNPSIANIPANGGGTYSVTVSAPGCNSTINTSVTVNASPSITAVTNNSRCGNGTVALGASASAGTISWFTASTGGSAIASGTAYTTPSISATTSYWVSSTSGSCTSPTRTEVIATVNQIPTVASSAGAARCGAGTVTLSATASAGVINWFSASSGGSSIGTGNSFTTPSISATTTYWAEASNNGCNSAARTAVVATINAVPSLGTAITNVACNGGANGVASVSPSGGVAPYTYSWSPSGGSAATATGLSAGNYVVTVTGSNGCSAQANITVTQPSALIANAASQTNVSCNGGSNGAASVSVSGGAGGYTYNWTPGNPTGDGTASVTGLTAGTWTCTVTDANGCTVAQNFTITQPTALVASAQSQTNVSCNGGSNGAASVSVSGGAGGYTYNWTPGNPTGDGTASVTGLTAGTWTCTVTDANGCTVAQNFTITQPTALVASAQSQTNIACNGGSNGAATVSVSGGAGGYTYNWTPGNPTGDGTASVTGLTAGTWTCSVTDANGCTATQNFTITQPTALVASAQSQTNVSCNGGSNGAASVSVSGGAGGYTYNWTPGNPTGDGTSSVTGLTAGSWTCTVTDANGCTATRNFTIIQPTALVASAQSQTNVSCNGGSNGAASVSVSGGAGGYTYNWTPGNPTGDGTASVTGLTAGTWTCAVTDANGCTATRNFTITQPTALVASAQSQTNVSCNGGSNGAASVSVSGGAGGYSYNWTPGNPNGDGSASISGLVAGSYVCTVTDANGCIASQSFTISEPSILVLSADAQTNVSCNGGNNGAASVIVSGGAGGYSFDWTGNPNGDGTASVSGLSAGNYVCTVTDANGCSASQSFEISEPSALVVSAASQTNVACNAGNNGAASVVVSGGTGDYTYDWTGNPDGDGTASIDGLIAGTYECTVTDANGCIASQSFTISEPIAPVTISGNPVEVLCFGGNNGAINVDISGGTAGYSFLWSNGEITEDISSLIAGEYILTVTDANGCSANEAFLVNQPMAQLDAVIGTIDVTCFEGNDGSISVEAFGGTAPYVYNWANIAANTADVSNLEAGLYELEIIDANGCDISRSVEINQPVNATSSMDVTSCDSYSLNNETYTESGIYTQILQNAAGCDSTLTLNLTILESTFSSMDVTVCDSYSLNGETYTESGVYTQMLQNAAGCDSTLTLNLTILESTFSSMDVTVCDSYSLNGETYTESGVYTQMLQNAAGCDSTLTLNLTILESTFSSMDVTVCDSYSLNGETYTESGVYTQLLQNAAGCDSTLTLNLTILESTFSSMDVTVCDSYSLNGETYTESGVYTQLLQNAAGCDSTLTLNLTILESTFSSMDVTVCDSYSLNGETYTESGVYTQMLQNAAGCDSTLTLNLTILESTFSSMDVTVCDSYSLNGETYTESGVYTQVLQNAAGCDSTLTLNLTILESTFSSMEITACDSYSLNGETYTASGVYTQVLQNAAGCDSTLTLNLTILQSSGEELTIIACDSYTLYGQTYTESGVYTQQLENVVGCELNVTLNLTILESSSSVLDVAACDSYTLNGEVYTESGVYTQVIPNAAGCDSTITLNLNIAQSSFTNIDIIAFQAFELDGVVYSESGEYNFAYESIAGCDSLVTYNITITTLAGDTNGDGEIGDGEVAGDTDGDGEIGDGEVAGDTDGDGEIGDGEVSGDTDGDGEIGDGEVAGDDNGDGSLGCDESAALGLLTETMEMVSCGPYTFEGMMFNESGIYVEQYMNENGCLVQVTLHLEVIDLNLQINPVDGALVSLQGFGADFQWIDCATNTAIAGANGQWFAPSQSGEYALQIGLGECEATTECVEFIALNQEELGASVLQVFPNPSQGVFRVRMSGTTDMQYEVFDAQGSMIKAGRWTNSENELNLEGCSSGVYHLRMGEQVIRLIIQ
jgi:hypothetical protein